MIFKRSRLLGNMMTLQNLMEMKLFKALTCTWVPRLVAQLLILSELAANEANKHTQGERLCIIR